MIKADVKIAFAVTIINPVSILFENLPFVPEAQAAEALVSVAPLV